MEVHVIFVVVVVHVIFAVVAVVAAAVVVVHVILVADVVVVNASTVGVNIFRFECRPLINEHLALTSKTRI